MRIPRRHILRGFLGLFLAALTAGTRALASTTAGEKKVRRLRKWLCTNQDCEPYVYDPSLGDENYNDPDNPIPPGVAFDELPKDWVCPVCGHPRSVFVALDEWVEVAV
ncbi:MAG: rubredoxin [Rhodospirillales bacterium]|nr:rubredoxin [Rhodospirillales bacterium]